MTQNREPTEFGYPEPFSVSAHDHEFCFMPDGVHRYDALLELIQKAEESLHFFYYMFQSDGAGTPIRDALVEAAKRGVEVSLIVDRFGTDAKPEFFDPLIDAGAQFSIFNPKKSRRYLVRNHQKMAIADKKIAILGGFNVSETYFEPPSEGGWCDMGVKVEGPLVDKLLEWYAQLADWSSDPNAQFRAVRDMVREWDPGDGPVQLLMGGPTRVPSTWSKQVKQDIIGAERLDLVMAYFSPPRSYRRTIRRVAKNGAVRLIMAGKSDNEATIAAARMTYGKMLRAGAQIFEFHPTKLHMKMIVVDDALYFGSANFDHRSIRLNLELMVRVKDQDLAKKLRDYITQMSEASDEITHEVHRKRTGLWSKIKGTMAWFMVTTADYTVSRSLNVGP